MPSFNAYTRLDDGNPLSRLGAASGTRRMVFIALGLLLCLAILVKTTPAVVPNAVVASGAVIATKLQTAWKSKGNALYQERITLIVMWDDSKLATYLPSLFRSAIYNADAVDLLFINVLRRGNTCLDVEPYIAGASNIKSYCISDWEDKAMIRNYFCETWQCTTEQVGLVDEHLRKERPHPIHVEFKPWRGGIYKEWIDTAWWAWLDADQIIGDFKNLWPWKAVEAFDVVTISQWDYGNIYLRGQFTAFKYNDQLEKIWLNYEPLSRPENLHTLPHGAVDEFAYSVLYSNTFADINWLLIPRALGQDHYGFNRVISHGKRGFYVPSDMTRLDMALLFDPSYAPPAPRIFADVEPFDVKKWSVPLRELRHGDYVNGKPLNPWCDQKETRCTVAREYYAYKSCVMRYNGQLLEYFDRRAQPRAVKQAGYFGIEEKLLLHWQEIKRQKWFRMPEMGVRPNEVLEMNDDYVVTWDIHTLDTLFIAHMPGHTHKPAKEPYGLDYTTFNDSGALPLPAGVLSNLQTLPLPELV